MFTRIQLAFLIIFIPSRFDRIMQDVYNSGWKEGHRCGSWPTVKGEYDEWPSEYL